MDQAQHLDAERLAAFMDGSLTRAERTAVEAHAADCAPCLQLLAAMARTEPVAPPTSWRLPVVLRWAVPLAAAATALALWVNVDRTAPELQRPTAPAASVDAVAPAPPSPVPTPQQPPAGPELSQRQRAASGAAANEAAKLSTPASEAREKQQPLADRDQERRADASANVERLEASVPRLPESTPAPSVLPGPPRAAAAGTPSPAASPTDAARVQKAPAVPAPGPAQAAETASSRAFATSPVLRAPVLPLDIVSPDPMVRWRVSSQGVQRSVDGGKTWGAPFAIAANILAGSSPSPRVAWLAGRGGAVVRTIDGSQWERVVFPETVDLLRIRATSDREAEVTLPDGRIFRTADGGRTWSLQEP